MKLPSVLYTRPWEFKRDTAATVLLVWLQPFTNLSPHTESFPSVCNFQFSLSFSSSGQIIISDLYPSSCSVHVHQDSSSETHYSTSCSFPMFFSILSDIQAICRHILLYELTNRFDSSLCRERSEPLSLQRDLRPLNGARYCAGEFGNFSCIEH